MSELQHLTVNLVRKNLENDIVLFKSIYHDFVVDLYNFFDLHSQTATDSFNLEFEKNRVLRYIDDFPAKSLSFTAFYCACEKTKDKIHTYTTSDGVVFRYVFRVEEYVNEDGIIPMLKLVVDLV